MTAELLVWLLSLGEAVLFFAGGLLFALYRAARADTADAAGEEQRAYQAALAGTAASGDVLRELLERETRQGGVAAAVIADTLGLVVAGQGELCEALAAYGAVLAGVGDKTREALAFNQVHKLTVQDERTTLTVRPIATAHDQFTLVTLTCAPQGVPVYTPAAVER